jgi:hypothetical protein
VFFDSVRQIPCPSLSKPLTKNKNRRTSFFCCQNWLHPPPPLPACFQRQTSSCHKEREDRETCRKEDLVAFLSVSADGSGGGGRASFNDSKEGGLLYNSCAMHGLII